MEELLGGGPVIDPIGSLSANGVHHPIYHFLAGDGGLYLLEVIQGEFGGSWAATGR